MERTLEEAKKIEKEKKLPRRLEGKVVIVTASSQGIGFEIIERFGLEGASVSFRNQMYNIYAEKEQWEKAAEIRKAMRKKNVSKEVGFSRWIDVGDTEGSLTMQGFSSGDKSHPKSDEIYRMVETIGLEINLEGKVAV